MRRKELVLVALCAVLGGLLAVVGQGIDGGTQMDRWSAPMLALGQGLRTLALAGGWGSAAVWAVTAVVCLLPLGVLIFWRRKRSAWHLEDALAGLAVPVLFSLLYYGINPTLLPGPMGQIYPVAAVGCLLSMLVAALVLKLLRGMEECPWERLAGACRPLLVGGAAFVAFSGVYSYLADALAQGQEVMEQNTADPEGAWFTAAVLVVLALLELTPYLMGAMALLWGAELSRVMGEGFVEETVVLSERTALGCKFMVQASVLMLLISNLTQLALLGQLRSTHFSVYIPLFPLLLAAGLFLLCRLVRRGRELQVDSDSII
ncbi:hypothetical protein [Flavonifractor sp. An100]|uniref:hypothetical protein n=1 Tax=Flavonifractor sp. An100 TaxID=1965538 RepID=UPI000B36C5C4|nr:hypothetical protein [Flavonifractor sp. An100]OUQ81605.1 hypothetical protein B5E43_01615 [Flavonifractor sp. An100]